MTPANQYDEIEVRYLAESIDLDIVPVIDIKRIKQVYVELRSDSHLRCRIEKGKKASFGIKRGIGLSRKQFEDDVALIMGTTMWSLGHYRLSKLRYVTQDGWEIDFLLGPLRGVILVEKELESCQQRDELTLPCWKNSDWVEVTETLNNLTLARLETELVGQNSEGLKQLDILARIKKVPRIVLTGGPCSGKSTLITELKSLFGNTLTFLPETATTVISHLDLKPGVLPTRDLQQTIYRAQDTFETSSMQMARLLGHRAVVVDRGTMDGAAYMDSIDKFERITQTSSRLEFNRYGLVIFLEMPDRDIYEQCHTNNPVRHEDYDEACLRAARTREVWQGHPRFVSVGGGNWEEKRSSALSTIDSYLASL